MRSLCLIMCVSIFICAAPKCLYAEGVSVKQYDMFEAETSVDAHYANPYNYDEVEVTAEITEPDGGITTVPAFYTGKASTWKVRYTPIRTGTFSYAFVLREGSRARRLKGDGFNVVSGNRDGFLRKGSGNPYYPVFDSGRRFFGIGHNIGWTPNNDISEYEKYFQLFNKNGCNLTRIWLNSPWTLNIEGRSLLNYNEQDCEKLDKLLKLAEKYGIYIVLSLDTYGSLMEEHGTWKEQFWVRNPYNKAAGGPCEKPWDFFSNNEAKRSYKNRVKYIIARWGYSPNIMAFELWNEVDAPAEWVKEMSSFIKNLNPHRQFVTTSMGYPWGNNFDETSIWKLDEIDIMERHLYGNFSRDIVENIVTVNKKLSSKYKKMIFVGEFGMDSDKNDATIDPTGEGVALHNSIWASAFSGSFAGAMNWWWEEYVKDKNLYHHYKALRNFVQDVDWGHGNVSFLDTTEVMYEPVKHDIKYSDAVIKTNDVWGETTYSDFSIDRAGNLSGGIVNSYLHGSLKKELRIEPEFRVNYPRDGKFILRLNMVSQGSKISVYLDGIDVLTKELPAGPGEGPWKRSLYRTDYKIYQCVYDTDLAIDVPKGKHTIRIANSGKDWVSITSITLTDYVSDEFANVRIVGLRTGNQMLIWALNKSYGWKEIRKGMRPHAIKNASFIISGIKDGLYEIEWWDTILGKVFKREGLSAIGGKLNVGMPEFTKDIACKIKNR